MFSFKNCSSWSNWVKILFKSILRSIFVFIIYSFNLRKWLYLYSSFISYHTLGLAESKGWYEHWENNSLSMRVLNASIPFSFTFIFLNYGIFWHGTNHVRLELVDRNKCYIPLVLLCWAKTIILAILVWFFFVKWKNNILKVILSSKA